MNQITPEQSGVIFFILKCSAETKYLGDGNFIFVSVVSQ